MRSLLYKVLIWLPVIAPVAIVVLNFMDPVVHDVFHFCIEDVANALVPYTTRQPD